MTHSQLVEQKLHEKDLMELLYRGVEPNSVVSDYDPNDYNRLCSMFDFDHSPITVRKPFNGTMEDYVQRATSENGWNMPDEYKDFDVQQFCFDQCTTDDQKARVALELIMFKDRQLLPMLKFLKYMVDTMRKYNIVWGVGRGSSVSSYVLYLLGVHKINSLKYNLDIKEFLK